MNHYLIATWAKICQAMGPEFEPYLPVVMPQLVNAASTKADISVYGTPSLEPYEDVTNYNLQMKMKTTSRSGKAGRHYSSTVRLWAYGRRPSKRNVRRSRRWSYTVQPCKLNSHLISLRVSNLPFHHYDSIFMMVFERRVLCTFQLLISLRGTVNACI